MYSTSVHQAQYRSAHKDLDILEFWVISRFSQNCPHQTSQNICGWLSSSILTLILTIFGEGKSFLCTLELKNLWRIITQKALKRIFALLNNLPIDKGFVDNHHIFTYRQRGKSLNNVSTCLVLMSKVRNTCSGVLGVGGSRRRRGDSRAPPRHPPPPQFLASPRSANQRQAQPGHSQSRPAVWPCASNKSCKNYLVAWRRKNIRKIKHIIYWDSELHWWYS